MATVAAESSGGSSRWLVRLLILIPALFGIVGAAMVAVSVWYRAYQSPTAGMLLGGSMFAVAAVSAVQLWRGARSAPILLIASGACLLVAIYSFLRTTLGDMVNASDEPPSFWFLHWFSITVVVVGALTMGGFLLARRWLLGASR